MAGTYHGSAIPTEETISRKFSGWDYNTWTLADLQKVAAAMRLAVEDGFQKRDLYQSIVELKPEPLSLSLAERNAIQEIKNARTASKAVKSRHQGELTKNQTSPASMKRRSSSRYRGTPRKRRWTSDVDDLSSDSEYVDSEDGDIASTALRSSLRTVSYRGSTNSTFSSPSSPLTGLDEFATLGNDSESSHPGRQAEPVGPTSIQCCAVCSDVLSYEKRLARRPTSDCLHDDNPICLSCLRQHIAASVTSQSRESIVCPHHACRAVLGFNDMQSFGPPEIFKRYDEHVNKRGLEALNDYVSCSNVGCDSGGTVNPAIDSFATCSSCGIQTCVVCRTRYHPGVTRAEHLEALKDVEQDGERAQERLEEERASEKFVEKKTKSPNQDCDFRIQKISGCNHMTCAQCCHEFCWISLAEYDAIRRHGNARHAKTCKFHSSRLR